MKAAWRSERRRASLLSRRGAAGSTSPTRARTRSCRSIIPKLAPPDSAAGPPRPLPRRRSGDERSGNGERRDRGEPTTRSRCCPGRCRFCGRTARRLRSWPYCSFGDRAWRAPTLAAGHRHRLRAEPPDPAAKSSRRRCSRGLQRSRTTTASRCFDRGHRRRHASGCQPARVGLRHPGAGRHRTAHGLRPAPSPVRAPSPASACIITSPRARPTPSTAWTSTRMRSRISS